MIYYCNLRLSANPEDAEYIISRHQNFYEVVRYKKINKRFRLHRIFAKINPARDNYTASDWIDIINCKADEPSKLPDIILKYPRPKKTNKGGNNMRTEILSEQEVLVLISALERAPVRDEFIIRLMLQCGLRAGEVQRLMTSDIYTANQTNNAIKLTAATTKNHRSRIIDMPAPVRACADRYKTFMIDMKLFNNEPMPLFINLKTKKPLSIRQIQYIVETHSVYALHRKIHPHVLRHTYATMLLKYTNIRVVQQLLGHSSLQSTQIYTHPNSEDCKKAVESTFDK